MRLGDVTVLEGNYTFDKERPCVILDAATAQRAIVEGDVTELIGTALRALYLADKAVVYVCQSEDES